MKIDLDWIQKELDAGREVELECVDRDGFLSKQVWRGKNQQILDKDKIIAEAIIGPPKYNNKAIGLMGDGGISESELKYFRIKRSDPTFKDLINVAVQAYEDGVISHLELYDGGLSSISVECADDSCSDVIESAINKIKSLYTETFVIKDFSDTKKLKSGAKALLSNGEEVVFSNRTGADDSLWFEYKGCHSAIIPYIALKGATVTQKRGYQ